MQAFVHWYAHQLHVVVALLLILFSFFSVCVGVSLCRAVFTCNLLLLLRLSFGLLLLLHLQFAFAQQLLHCENTLEKINSCQGKFKFLLNYF